MSERLPFDPSAMVARLIAGGVDFVIIGGLAATLQGAELPTLDLDISREVEQWMSPMLDKHAVKAGMGTDNER